MSRQLVLDTIYLKPTSRLAHTEYSLDYHTDYIRKKIGLDLSHPDCMKKFYDLWGIDFIWNTNDGLHADWLKLGRATDMGHAEYEVNGSDKKNPVECPFKTVEEVWAFDAIAEYSLPDLEKQVKNYEKQVENTLKTYPEQLVTGGYYKTIVSGAIQTFGWDMLLLALSDIKKMEQVFDSFYRFTLFHMEAWAKTSVEVIIQHDDFVWTNGAFMYPDIYRKIIIPRFAELWKPLHRAGKKILFCSDGNFMEFALDIVKAGADGLIFEPCNDFGWMVEKFGQSTVLVGSYVDCRDLTFGTFEKVRPNMDRTFELAKKCKGLIFAVGNHMPANIPEEMMDKFIEYLQKKWYIL